MRPATDVTSMWTAALIDDFACVVVSAMLNQTLVQFGIIWPWVKLKGPGGTSRVAWDLLGSRHSDMYSVLLCSSSCFICLCSARTAEALLSYTLRCSSVRVY